MYPRVEIDTAKLPLHVPLVPLSPKFSQGPLIQHWLLEAGMTEKQLAEAVGDDSGLVFDVREGQAHVPDKDLAKWADALRVDRQVFALMMLRCSNPFTANGLGVFGPDAGLREHLDGWRARYGSGRPTAVAA